MAGLVFVVGLGFALWLWRYLVVQGRAGSAALSAAGWSGADLRRLWRTLLAWVGVPATILGAGVSGLLSAGSDVPQAGPAAAVALATGLILSLGMAILLRAEGKRP